MKKKPMPANFRVRKGNSFEAGAAAAAATPEIPLAI